MSREVAREVVGARIGQHPAGLPLQLVGIAQLAANRGIEELVVRDAAPQEKRQAGSQLEVAYRVRAAGDVQRIQLYAEEELRIDEDRAERSLDAAVEVARRAPFAVEGQRPFEILHGNGPAVGAAHQGREDLPRARFFVGRPVRPADEDAVAARRLGGALRRVRSGHRHLVDGGRLAGMPCLVEVRLQGLALGLGHRVSVPRERDAELVGTRGDRHAHLQVPIQQRVVAVDRPRDREAPDGHPVEQELQFVRPGIAQAADVAAAVAGQEHLDVVLSVLRKGVRHDHAAPRAGSAAPARGLPAWCPGARESRRSRRIPAARRRPAG